MMLNYVLTFEHNTLVTQTNNVKDQQNQPAHLNCRILEGISEVLVLYA